ncbi:MAG: MATE family efflux transporter [Lachnospiraceae bacterium]|nr:MATE family efflux transporter [Lachnospiraceae bacterium]
MLHKVDKDTVKVFKMSLPIFVELLLQLLVGNIDQIMISHYSQTSVAAIGNGNQIMNIAIIVLSVISVATTILIAQYLGAKYTDKANEVSSVSTLIMFIASISITLVCVLFGRQIFTLLKAPSDVLTEASTYLAIVGSFLIVQGLYLNLTGIMRSFGLLNEIMIVSLIMNALNILGNASLIYGLFGLPSLGLIGVAISTNLSKLIGLIIILIIFKKKVDVHISIRYLHPFPKETLKKLLNIGVPSALEQLSYNLSQTCIMAVINVFGTSVINTKVYSSMLANVSYVYAMAIGQATQILIGYFIGAKLYDRIKKRAWTAIYISLAVSLSVTAILYLNSDFVFGLFTSDPAVLELGKKILFIEFFLEIGRSINITMTKSMVAAGDVYYPVIVGIICMWSIALGLSYVFAIVLNMGLVGVWLAMAIDEAVRGIIFSIHWNRGKWIAKSRML